MGFVTRGFHGRRRDEGPEGRVPPGQYLTDDFPVLSAGPTPHTPLEEWTFAIEGGAEPVRWTWDELQALPSEDVTVDIHCVTRWSKPGIEFTGILLEDLLNRATIDVAANFISFIARSERAHSTSLPMEVALQQETLLAWEANGAPLELIHGGPLRVVADDAPVA